MKVYKPEHTHTQAQTQVRTDTYTHMHAHAQTYTRIHTRTITHTHTHLWFLGLLHSNESSRCVAGESLLTVADECKAGVQRHHLFTVPEAQIKHICAQTTIHSLNLCVTEPQFHRL